MDLVVLFPAGHYVNLAGASFFTRMLRHNACHLLLRACYGAGDIFGELRLMRKPLLVHLQAGNYVVQNVARKKGLVWIGDDEAAQLKHSPTLRPVGGAAHNGGGADVSDLRAAAEAGFTH